MARRSTSSSCSRARRKSPRPTCARSSRPTWTCSRPMSASSATRRCASIEEPAITHSLRGMTYIEIEVEGPHDDLHSGFYGGAVAQPGAGAGRDPRQAATTPINSIAVPGFYDDVVAADRDGTGRWSPRPRSATTQFKEATGVPAVWGDERLHHQASASRPARRWRSTAWGAAGPAPARRRSSRRRHGQAQLPPGRQPGSAQDLRADSRSYIESLTPPTVRLRSIC